MSNRAVIVYLFLKLKQLYTNYDLRVLKLKISWEPNPKTPKLTCKSLPCLSPKLAPWLFDLMHHLHCMLYSHWHPKLFIKVGFKIKTCYKVGCKIWHNANSYSINCYQIFMPGRTNSFSDALQNTKYTVIYLILCLECNLKVATRQAAKIQKYLGGNFHAPFPIIRTVSGSFKCALIHIHTLVETLFLKSCVHTCT